jgi:WXXGXW repeat (2 copies)
MNLETITIRRAFGAIIFSGALALAAGCHSSSVAASGPDPAQANLAPVNGQTQVLAQNASYAPQQQGESYPQQQGYPQQAPAPIEQGYPQQAGSYYPSDTEQAGEEALEETTQAPPELPEYDQPPAPGPGYLWTPGYWAWGPGGYYWVPGAWVEAPYYGALWTPPYWGWYGGYYRFHPGYWGRHVGYYGGINYGFGYIGIGYFGGYWSGNSFYYNRAVTRVGGGIRTVYERPVVYNNVRYDARPNNRVSYNGGRGGINVQPRPAEVAAMHERHDAPLAVQHQVRVEASQNRGQSFAANHGRPSEAFVQHGFANTRGIAPAPRVEAARPMPEGRPVQPNAPYVNERAANGVHGQPNSNEPRVENRAVQPQPNPANPRFENRAQPQPQPNGANPRFENHAQPQPQPRVEAPHTENRPMQPQPNAGQPRFENHSQPQPRPENRAMPQPQPQPRVENRPMQQPQPQPRVENRPQPEPQQHMEAPRPENRPAPQPHPQGPPPQAHPAPQAHGGGGHQGDGDHGHR